MNEQETIQDPNSSNETAVVRKYMDVNEHERLSNITLRNKFKQGNMRDYPTLHLDKIQAREHERLSNITLRHKFKQRNNVPIADLHFTVTIGSYIYSITHTLK